MKTLMLGVYDIKGYSRGRIIYKGLKKNKADVDIFIRQSKNRYVQIAKRILKKDYDIILATGKIVLFLSWVLKPLHRKKVIFDAFISDYDNLVNDRTLVKKNSLKARLLWLGDKISCMIADKIILDTDEHIKYFCQEFRLDKKKFDSVFIGADEEIFHPLKKKLKKDFTVLFHGTFIPLQGIGYILRAAKILERKNIYFEIIGKGQTYEEMVCLAKRLDISNVKFIGFVDINALPKHISRAHICLGIFGDTEKALKVIPNKAYEIIAMKKPLITADTPAIKELFTHKKDCYLCNIADENSLADAILTLKKDKKLRERMAVSGFTLFKKDCNSKKIGKKILNILNNKKTL